MLFASSEAQSPKRKPWAKSAAMSAVAAGGAMVGPRQYPVCPAGAGQTGRYKFRNTTQLYIGHDPIATVVWQVRNSWLDLRN